jgi:hypothetical protein
LRKRAGAGDAGGMRGGPGGGGATWETQKKPTRGREAAGPVLGRHVAQPRAARRWRGCCTWPVRAAEAAQRGNRGAGAGGGRRGLVCDFPKVQGPHYNVLVTFKPELK